MKPLVLVLALCLATPAPAAAEPFHGAIGVGGWTEPIHGAAGVWAGLDLWSSRRWGSRVDAWIETDGEPVRVEASLARILGNSRPHLVVALHGGGGWSFGDDALLVAAGIAGQLGLRLGPLALGLDGTAHGAASDDSFRLFWTTTLAVLAAW